LLISNSNPTSAKMSYAAAAAAGPKQTAEEVCLLSRIHFHEEKISPALLLFVIKFHTPSQDPNYPSRNEPPPHQRSNTPTPLPQPPSSTSTPTQSIQSPQTSPLNPSKPPPKPIASSTKPSPLKQKLKKPTQLQKKKPSKPRKKLKPRQRNTQADLRRIVIILSLLGMRLRL
jgi:hypothetical protein